MLLLLSFVYAAIWLSRSSLPAITHPSMQYNLLISTFMMACASEADLLLFPKIKTLPPLETFFISANRDLFLDGFIHMVNVEWFIAPGLVCCHSLCSTYFNSNKRGGSNYIKEGQL